MKQINGIHIYQGNCPDEINPFSRDENCPVCKAISYYERYILNQIEIEELKEQPFDEENYNKYMDNLNTGLSRIWKELLSNDEFINLVVAAKREGEEKKEIPIEFRGDGGIISF